MVTRRQLLKITAALGLGLVTPWQATAKGRAEAGTSRFVCGIPLAARQAIAQAQITAGAMLDPASITKYGTPLVIPPAMPRTSKLRVRGGKNIDYYEIAVRQFSQQILPAGMPTTTVWGYGSVNHPGSFNYPSFTIEAKSRAPVRVKWINDLVDASGNYLPHLLPVDQTLHWANPPGPMPDTHSMDPAPYTGPVPIVTHVHGARTTDESDGYAEAWFLPKADNIPASFVKTGTWYNTFKQEFAAERSVGHHSDMWAEGSATYEYPNDQRATTLWYHDHALGMTRLNVYAGPAGFYILRGGPSDAVQTTAGRPAVLPGPAPALGDRPGTKYNEIPLAIQDRSFTPEGQLFYPDNRAFFEGLDPEQLQIPFIPEIACDGEMSDISPIWNPEFFGTTMLVNGKTWPVLDVQPRRYRFRLLNGCNSRFLILKLVTGPADAPRPITPALPFTQIGAEGGFLPAPVTLDQLLIAPAERADVIVDFAAFAGQTIYMINEAPDEPFGGGLLGTDYQAADPATTGQVMMFRVSARAVIDPTTPPAQLVLPALGAMPPATKTRRLALIEEESATVRVVEDEDGNIVLACANAEAAPFGPRAALLGVMEGSQPKAKAWMDQITENPALGATEVWEIYNFTADAHPIHVHEVMFRIINRQPFNLETGALGAARPPETWESGPKDTVIAYPGEVTRIQATFDLPGLYVWHCHIVEHEDNEMMRPYTIGPAPSLNH